MKLSIETLPDYAKLKSQLDSKIQEYLEEYEITEEVILRKGESAGQCIDCLASFHRSLVGFLNQYPYFENLFAKEFLSFEELIDEDNIFDTVFFESFVVPEKSFIQLSLENITPEEGILELEGWQKGVLVDHEICQENLKENLDLNTEFSSLVCKCNQCYADFRSFLRIEIMSIVKETLANAHEEIDELIEKDIFEVSDRYRRMQKSLEKTLAKVRHKFKKASFHKLQAQINNLLEEKFYYPTGISIKYSKALSKVWKQHLVEMDVSPDILTGEEYERFLSSLGSKLYRPKSMLLKDFSKFVKSIMLLKRKDISGNILSEYLGEFWVYSTARKVKRKIIYHMGPTNSGKTYHAIEALSKAKTGTYLAPLRLLAAELYDTMNKKGALTSLLTGEEVIEVEGATHFSSTIEMAKLGHEFESCVIDEIQMISDNQRGWAWTRALVGINAKEIHLCGDHSALDLVKKIVNLCEDELEIKTYERMTKLVVEKHPIKLRDLRKSDALIVFSRRNALRFKYELEKLNFKVSIIYGRLSPEVRREQARKFDEGETDVIVSTDAIAMGMNLPIKRIVFSTLKKFFNSQEYEITDSEIKQISGRAGRYGRFPTGFVNCLYGQEGELGKVRESIEVELDQNEKCMVGPDLDIFTQINSALTKHGLHELKFSEFLNIFNAMIFSKPFYCVELREMIEVAETVEDLDENNSLSKEEVFGFSCAPVNLGLLEHVQYFTTIVGRYVKEQEISNPLVDYHSNDIDYLETSIKCVELYQWLSRHFGHKLFVFDQSELMENKKAAIEKLNTLLGERIVPKKNFYNKSNRDKKFGGARGNKKRFRKKKTGSSAGFKSSKRKRTRRKK